MEYFYSKSKKGDNINCGYENWRQILSNFYESEITYNNITFKSVESLFHYFKFENNYSFYASKFSFYDSKTAKKMGGKTMCKKNNVELDINWWNSVKFDKMKLCIKIRYESDKIFRHIIDCLKKKNIIIVHFSRNDGFWGAKIKDNKIIGKNILGKLIMEYY